MPHDRTISHTTPISNTTPTAPRSRVRVHAAAAVLIAGALGAYAQGPSLPSEPGRPGQSGPVYAHARGWWSLEQADQFFEDRGPLSNSLRVPQTDLRFDAGWGNLYRLPTTNGEDLFVRRNLGVSAVFTQSEYLATPFGTFSMVPTDAQFIIGEPPQWLLKHLNVALGAPDGTGPGFAPPEGSINRAINNRLDYSISGRLDDAGPAEARDLTAQEIAMIAKARTRRPAGDAGPATRSALLRRAAAAEMARGRIDPVDLDLAPSRPSDRPAAADESPHEAEPDTGDEPKEPADQPAPVEEPADSAGSVS